MRAPRRYSPNMQDEFLKQKLIKLAEQNPEQRTNNNCRLRSEKVNKNNNNSIKLKSKERRT